MSADDFGREFGNVDQQAFRNALARVCTPVTVVTAQADGRPHGTTVSSFSSLSLDPPLVLISLDRGSDLLTVIRTSGRFGVNVLSFGQQDVASAFARKGGDKFAGIAWHMDHQLPRLCGSGGWIACRTDRLVPAGDHVIVIGLVQDADTHSFDPLLYRQRSFGAVTHVTV